MRKQTGIKIIQRGLRGGNEIEYDTSKAVLTGPTIEAAIGNWLNQGWELFKVISLGVQQPDEILQMVFILVHYEDEDNTASEVTHRGRPKKLVESGNVAD